MDWIIENSATLISAVIGVVGALLGVIITMSVESKKRRKELIDQAKPILINQMAHEIADKSHTPKYLFSADDERSSNITGVFRNTDNGILFWDYIKTETKTFRPVHCNAVDKNTDFYIVLTNLEGENLKYCRIYCHDIFDNKYYFNAHFCFESGAQSQIMIDDSMPCKCTKNDK